MRMNHSRQSSNRHDDLPLAVTMLAMSFGKGISRVGCVIADQQIFCVGTGDAPELDAVSKFGTKLLHATMYTTRLPEDTLMKFLEKCGLRRLVLLQNPPAGHNPGMNRNLVCVEYAGECLYRLRDMVRSLEQEASV